MRLIHSSDWHLGHTLHGSSREEEHRAFLTWLLDRIEEESVEGMILAGDLFDSANPPVSALRLWYRFLHDLGRRVPGFQLVLIGGNHDSASRLEAPRELIADSGVQVVGSLPRAADGAIDMDRLLIPLRDSSGGEPVLVAALPFLRMTDLPRDELGDLDPVAGVRAIHEEVLGEALRRRATDQSLIVTGHCYMVAGRVSELSERKILGGGQHALPTDLFPDEIDYVALGHLHLAQSVGGRDEIRYSGSPIPLSLSEKDYPHQILIVDLEASEPVAIRSVRVPRTREILRVPQAGAGTLDEVLVELAGLPDRDEHCDEDRLPMLEVRVRLDGPEPGLRRRIDEVLAGDAGPPEAEADVTEEASAEQVANPVEESGAEPRKPKRKRKKKPVYKPKQARLVKLTVERAGTSNPLADQPDLVELRELEIEEVFGKRYEQVHGGEVDAKLLAAFRELQSAELEEGGG